MDRFCARHPDRPAAARCVMCGATRCSSCRVRVKEQNYCRPCVPVALRGHLPGRRSPAVAAFLSVLPGLGQMYAGRGARGFVFLAASVALAAGGAALPVPLPIFLWVYNLLDAHTIAVERNAAVEGREPDAHERRQRRFFGALGAGTALFALARLTVAPHLDAALLWPAALVLYGLFIVADRRHPDVQHA